MNTDVLIDQVRFDGAGLVTAIAQDYQTNEVLMVAYMNEATLRQTLETGVMTYWSRSRKQVWVKGETSGHTQDVREVRLDCDGDALVFKVRQHGGAACHTGYRSCFFRRFDDGRLVEAGVHVFDPAEVYGEEHDRKASIEEDDAMNYQPEDIRHVALGMNEMQAVLVAAPYVHDAWAIVKIGQGYRYGETTSDEDKTHRDLVRFEELSDEAQIFDIELASTVIRALKRKGWRLVPPDGSPSP